MRGLDDVRLVMGRVGHGCVSMHGVIGDDSDVVIVVAFTMCVRADYGIYGGVRW